VKIQRYKHESEYSYTLGMSLTIELLVKRPQDVSQVFISSSIEKNKSFEYLEQLCKDSGIPMETNDKIFNLLSAKGNCFVIAVFSKYECMLNDKDHLVLVNPADAGNLGTIIRTAVGFNIKNLVIIAPAVDIFDPKTIRASMGAVFHIDFTYYESFKEYRKQYSSHFCYSFIFSELSVPIKEVSFKQPYSLIFGNEASGLPEEFSSLEKGQAVVIPHNTEIDSLNLPIAVGIALYTADKDERASR